MVILYTLIVLYITILLSQERRRLRRTAFIVVDMIMSMDNDNRLWLACCYRVNELDYGIAANR